MLLAVNETAATLMARERDRHAMLAALNELHVVEADPFLRAERHTAGDCLLERGYSVGTAALGNWSVTASC